MSTDAIVVTIVASLLSGALATIVTLYINSKRETLRRKKCLVEDIFGYRYQLTDKHPKRDELENALNKKIDIIFTSSTLNEYFKEQIMEDMIKLC